MSLRTSDALILLAPLLLAGCGGGTAQPDGNRRMIACGPLSGELGETCLLEVENRKGDLFLTLRQPGGGFRRLLWPREGNLAVADGAEALETVPLNGGGVEARIGGWRYRIEKKGGGLP
jgi:hypothetical protein